MGKEEDLEKELRVLEAKLRDRKNSIPAHSPRPQQILLIEELETSIEEKTKKLERLREEKKRFSVD